MEMEMEMEMTIGMGTGMGTEKTVSFENQMYTDDRCMTYSRALLIAFGSHTQQTFQEIVRDFQLDEYLG